MKPPSERYFRHLQTLGFLRRAPACSRQRIQDFQFTHLKAIVTHAYTTIPYYRNHYDAHGFHPGRLKSLEDISRIPIVRREDLKGLSRWMTTGVRTPEKRLVKRLTSGTTGVKVAAYRTWFEERLLNAFRWRAQFSYGQQLKDITAVVLPWEEKPNSLHRIGMAFNCLRSKHISIFYPPQFILQRLETIGPDVIQGYPGVLEEVARCIPAGSRSLKSPKYIFVGGETLFPHARELISSRFNARVINMYGAYEFNLIASECKATGDLHVCDDGMILEVLDRNDKPVPEGETGEAVGTTLHSYTMPFIRYRLGDMVVKGAETCSCGAPFSTLRDVEGRVIDYFTLPSGRKMHPYHLTKHVFPMTLHLISQYLVTQRAPDRITISLVFEDAPDPGLMERLKRACQEEVGRAVTLDLEAVEHIPRSETGKAVLFRSLRNGSEETASTRWRPWQPGVDPGHRNLVA